MAGMTVTIDGNTYGSLTSSNGSYALGFTATPIDAWIRYHIYGTTGSLTNYGGSIGYGIRVRVRYVGLTPYTNFATDSDSFRAMQGASIIGPGFKAYTRCKLDPGGARVIREPIAMGRGIAGQQFMDVEYSFTSDGG